jgi:hypothetical protein
VLSRLTGRVLFFSVLLGLLLLAGYVAYRFLLPIWIAVLFYSYAASTVAVAIFGTIGFAHNMKPRTTKDIIWGSIVRAHRKFDLLTRLTRVRQLTAGIAGLIASAPVWPADALNAWVLIRKRLGTFKEFVISASLRPTEHYRSLYALTIVLIVFGLEFRGINLGAYGTIGLWSMLACVTLRHLQYSIQTPSLPAVLRRASASPYVVFLTIVVADFSTLVIAFTGISKSTNVSGVTLSNLRDTAEQLLTAREPLRLLKGIQLTAHQIIIATVGLLFYLALFKILGAFGEFRRNDEDYIWMASVDNTLGKFSAALRHLRNAKSWNTQARVNEIIALIGVNDVVRAEEQVCLALSSEHKELSSENIFGTMWQPVLYTPLPEDAQLAVFQVAIRLGVRDPLVQDCLATVTSSETLKLKLIDLFSLAKEKYPITLAKLLFAANKREAALEILKDTESPLILDDLVRRITLIFAILANPDTTASEDAEEFRGWLAANLPRIREFIKEKGTRSWERVIAFSQIKLVLQIAQKAAPANVEELTFLCDSLKVETEGQDASLGFKIAELSIEGQTRAM